MLAKNRKAQSTLEYVIVLTAIIAVIIAFAWAILGPKVKSSLTHVADEMNTQVGRIKFGK